MSKSPAIMKFKLQLKEFWQSIGDDPLDPVEARQILDLFHIAKQRAANVADRAYQYEHLTDPYNR